MQLIFSGKGQKGQVRVGYRERLDLFARAINSLYLTCGGYGEIIQMSYWDFISIMNTKAELVQIQSGKPLVKQGLYDSQKSMIDKRKQQR